MKKSQESSKTIKGKEKKVQVGKKFSLCMRRRLAYTFFGIMLALLVLSLAILRISTTNYDDYSRQVLAQQGYDNETIPYRRGNIVDRNGAVLATSETVYNLILDPYVILSDEDITAPTLDALAACFGYDRDVLENTIREKPESSYIRYAKQLSEEEKERFEAIQESVNSDRSITDVVKGVWFETEYKRVYPGSTLACDLIGFASHDGASGNYGIEQYYNDVLTGTNGRKYGYFNSDNYYEIEIKAAEDGKTVVSTIDANLQSIVEKKIQEFSDAVGADNICVIMMNPKNGEVLTMANAPFFDLNDPYDMSAFFSEEEIEQMDDETRLNFLNGLWKNFVVSTDYEPGSTAKIFTVASGLEEGKLSPTNLYQCDGYEMMGGWRINCHVTTGHGEMDLAGAIVNSCNDALMEIVKQTGVSAFKKYQEIFGLGQKTGIDLPGEETGQLKNEEEMGETDLATNSFGQCFTVTIAQMAAAYCSVINGGTYYQPHVVKEILNTDGTVEKSIEPKALRETVSTSTSEFLIDAMVKTIENGSSYSTEIAGYKIGGKTGTAQKLPRADKTYIVSLASFLPADDPELFMMVVIDEPHVENQSTGGYATSLTKEILEEVIPYLNIPKTADSGEGQTQNAADTSQEFGEAGIIEENLE